MEEAPARAGVQADTEAESRTDQPQLCPDPGPDAPHGASPSAKAYQAQISLLNNPLRPLAPGLAVSLINPQTGKRVVYDDCRESDGTMIEAKGPGFARMLRSAYFSERVLPARRERQARRQLAASGGREVEWYFAEPEAADSARELFADDNDLRKIKIIVVPADAP